MSIRQDKFKDKFIPLWEEITEIISKLDSKGLSTEDRDEIAHLRKVSAYLKTMFDNVEPDFIPLKTLDNLSSPLTNIKTVLTNYINSENITYIKSINNDYMDTLLRDVMPFIIYKGETSTALKNAINEYSQAINKHSQDFLSRIQTSATTFEESKKKIDTILEDISKIKKQIDNYNNELFDDNGLKSKISEMISDIENKKKNLIIFIKKFSQKMMV